MSVARTSFLTEHFFLAGREVAFQGFYPCWLVSHLQFPWSGQGLPLLANWLSVGAPSTPTPNLYFLFQSLLYFAVVLWADSLSRRPGPAPFSKSGSGLWEMHTHLCPVRLSKLQSFPFPLWSCRFLQAASFLRLTRGIQQQPSIFRICACWCQPCVFHI